LKTFLYSLWSKFITFIGDIKFFGWNHPFWFVINVPDYKLKGEHYREIIKLIQPGDILLRRCEQDFDKCLIPGYWTHCGIYFGGERERVIHAISDGVVIEDIINFMRTDELMILRAPPQYVEKALGLAKEMVNQSYDFLFNFNDSNRLSCSELIYCCYHRIIRPKKRLHKITVVADDIIMCKDLKVIWSSRK